MKYHDLTPKVPQLIHVNHASASAVRSWQYRLKGRISRLKDAKFVIVALDEAFFVYDTKTGRKYWAFRGTRIRLPYTGSHKKVAVYGAISECGRQLFRTYNTFDAPTFIAYLKELHAKWGKVAILCDKASPHTAKEVKKFLKKHKDIKIIYLPTGSPYLNPVEACWKEGKRKLLVSEYYKTFDDMRTAVSKYYRITKFKLDMSAYLYRSPSKLLTNLFF